MKITSRDASGLLSKASSKYLAFLLYGQDQGLARERSFIIARQFTDNFDDPFTVNQLSGNDLADDKLRLADEANALNPFGGIRLVMVTGNGTEMTNAVKLAFENMNPDTRIIIRATDVNTRHALVKLCDGADFAASIGCYADDNRTLSQLATEIFSKDNIKIEKPALDLLISRLGADRQSSRSELEKLALFSGPDSQLSSDDIDRALGDSAAIMLDELALAVLNGQIPDFERHYARLRREGIQPIAVLRQILSLFKGMLTAKLHMRTGKNALMAAGQIRPPIHFKIKNDLIRQLGNWNETHIQDAIDRLIHAEIQIKSSGIAEPATLAGQSLLGLCLLAKKRNR